MTAEILVYKTRDGGWKARVKVTADGGRRLALWTNATSSPINAAVHAAETLQDANVIADVLECGASLEGFGLARAWLAR